MAITYIKNGVDRHWRKGAISPIDPDEKETIRHHLLSGMEEPVNQVSIQLAVLISRIARMDCPEQWPQLLPILSTSIQSQSALLQQRALLTLKHVVKTLAGRRLANDRKMFYNITEQLFVNISELWERHTQQVLSSEPAAVLAVNVESAKNCLKILRQLIVFGFARFHVIAEVLTVVSVLFDRIKLFLDYRKRCDTHLADNMESMITVSMKTLLELHSHHPLGYVAFLNHTYQLIISYVFTSTGADKLYDKFVVQCMKLLRQILKCEDYQMPSNILSSVLPPAEVMQAQLVRTTVFKSDLLREITHQLITSYLILNNENIQHGLENPEEFVQGEGDGEIYEVSVKPCVEVTFLTIFSQFQDTVKPIVMEMLHKVQGRDLSSTDQELLEKEAVYRAVGLAAYELYDEIDYDNWYSTYLIRELEITDQRYMLVRYRVVWLLGHWVSVKMSTELRPSLYSCLLQLLHPSERLLIRLAASQSLYSSVDDFTFTAEDFSPFLSDMMSHLLQLLTDVEDCDTKLKVLRVISLIIESSGHHIQPHVLTIAQQMPLLWEQSAKHNLLRCSILTTLMKITQGLGNISTSLHSLLIPVITLATDPTQDSYVYLGEDGLTLWLTTLEYSSSLSLELVHLFSQNMSNVMGLSGGSSAADLSPESLLTCFKIIEHYCILGGADFLQACGGIIVSACQEYISDVKRDCVVAILEVLNRIIKTSHLAGAQLIHQQLFTVFLAVVRAEDHPPVMSGYFTTLAHLLYYSSMTFFSLIEQASTQLHQNVEDVFCSFVDLWHSKLNIIISLEQRKIVGLAISTLLPINDRCVLSRFGVLFNMCVEVLHDMCDWNDKDVLFDNLCTPSGGDKIKQTPEHDGYCENRKKLERFDPVWTVELHQAVSMKLDECERTHGPTRFQLILQSVEWSIREQMCEYVPAELAVKLLAT
ncbi:importin-11-like isoform X2 [Dysidea avara]